MVARRLEHSREEITEMVTAAAERLGSAEGLRGITMRRLAASVGYAPNSIYHSVGDIDIVILRLNARTLAKLTRALKRRLTAGQTAEEAVMALVDGYMAFVRANARLWSILVDYLPRRARAFPDWYQAAFAEPFAVVDGVLASFFPEAEDRRRSVALLWATLHGIAQLSVTGKLGVVTREDALPLARLAVARFLAGRTARA